MLILANRLDGGLDGSLSPHSTVVRPHVSDVSPQLMSSFLSVTARLNHSFPKCLGASFRLVPLHCPKTSQLVKPKKSMIDPMASTSGYFPGQKLYAGGLPPPGGLSPLPGDLTRLDDCMN